MKPTPFPSKTTPWRVMLPARYLGKRTAKYFATEGLAKEFCRTVKKFGASALEQKSPATVSRETNQFDALVRTAIATFGDEPTQLFQAIEHYKKTRLNLTQATVRQAVEEFQKVRTEKKNLKLATVDSDRYRLLKLVNAFERRQMSEITEVDLRHFFDELGRKMNTRSIYKSVRTLFGWAKKYNYVSENPMLNITPEHQFGVNNDIYTLKEFRRMLHIAAGLEGPKPGKEPTRDFIDMLPWFVLGGFCGLRNCEAFRLSRDADAIRWSDLYFDRGFIHIREEIAKSTKRNSDERHIERPHALAAAKAWLEFAERKGELMVPWTKRHVQELKRRFTKATGVKFKENALRNSFASYALTYTGLDGVGKLALEMGNSEAIAKRHYIKTLEPGTGKAWFELRPEPANVVSIHAAAA